ncbi:MAG: S41 family peptidase [Coriobacteriaceae bacterium]
MNSGVLVIQGNDGWPPPTGRGRRAVQGRAACRGGEPPHGRRRRGVAASLQDNERAAVVGETSMGKGTVQVVRELDIGGAVRYTAAYYLTPQGEPIDNVGIAPQVGVVNGEGEDGADSQLATGIDIARSLIPAA